MSLSIERKKISNLQVKSVESIDRLRIILTKSYTLIEAQMIFPFALIILQIIAAKVHFS